MGEEVTVFLSELVFTLLAQLHILSPLPQLLLAFTTLFQTIVDSFRRGGDNNVGVFALFGFFVAWFGIFS